MENITIYSYLILCPLVFIAGFIDAIAGGGGLITVPAYLMIGLPSHNAVATNKLSSTMGCIVATTKYALNGYIHWKNAFFCVLITLGGAWIGSNLVLLIPENVFGIIFVVVLPFIAAYVLTHKSFETDKEKFSPQKTLLLCLIIAFFIGMYDGFYGPGTGTFLMLSLTGLARLTLNEAAGTTKAINLTSNMTSLAVFLYNGKVLLVMGLIAGLFSIAGNFLGARTFTKNGAKIARPVIITVLAILFVKIILEFFLKK
ncbi:MAG: TSUP family transporter [Treponema sp.]|nr:TSUP family transporter [Candidatus Treponema equifaecale]